MTTKQSDHNIAAAKLYAEALDRHLASDLDAALAIYTEVDALAPDYDDASFDGLIGRALPREMQRPIEEHTSCDYIENGLHALRDGLEFCCIPAPGGGRPKISNYSGGRLPLDIIIAKREDLRRKIATDTPNACSGCSYLKRDTWRENREKFLRFLIIDNHASCNARCVYCWVPGYYAQKLPMYPYRFDNGFKWLKDEQLL